MNVVVAAKITSLQRCVSRARQIRAAAGEDFRSDHDRQDACILNVIRACETAIDLASMVVRARRLGMPSETRELFALLEREQVIPADLGKGLRSMVGFRNLAVHQYREIDLDIVDSVIRENLDDLLNFGQIAGRSLGAINPRESS